MVEAGAPLRLADPAVGGPEGLRKFRGLVRNLGDGWELYGQSAGSTAGSGRIAGPVPTMIQAGETVPVIEQQWLDELDKVFVPPPEFDTARSALERRHVVVLQGLSGCGKTALGVQLLQSLVSGRPHCVYAVPGQLQPQAGYLVDDLGPQSVTGLDVARLRELQEEARAAKSYVVLTVDDEVAITRPMAVLLVPCTDPPDAREVVQRGLQVYFGNRRPVPAKNVLAERWAQDFLDARPLPGSVGHLVDTLKEVGRGRLRAADARERFAKARAQEIVEWFQRYPTVKDRCFMIAAAVFQGSSLEWVDQAARLLEDAFGGRTRTSSDWRLLSPRERRLRTIGAHLRQEIASTPAGVGPTLVVRFESAWLPGAILRHVWEEHDDAREALTAWLQRLAVEDTEEGAAAVPPAVALGVLGREDMAWLSRTIQQWVQSGRAGARDAAAIALAAFARGPGQADHVARVLHNRIREDPASSRSAVAAVAYGLLPDPPFAERALDDLRAVLQADRGQVAVVARSVAMLCDSQLAGQALDALWRWAQGNAPLGLGVFVLLTEWTRPPTQAWTDGHPLLLRAAEASEPHRRLVARLWRRAYDHGGRRERSHRRARLRRSLRTWLEYVQQRDDGGATVDAVISELAAHGARFRLLTWMDEWAGDLEIAASYRDELVGGNLVVLPVARSYRKVSGPFASVLRRSPAPSG